MDLAQFRRLCTLVAATALGFATCTEAAAAAPVSQLVVDAASGRTLYAVQASRQRPPASLTKMMTLLLAFEAIASGKLRADGNVVMSRRGARQAPSRLGLAAGRSIGVTAAMRAIAVISANDVAVALAEKIGGTESGFVRAMNRRAVQLGMTDTRFTNASGLAPGGGVTTARDMALLSRYIIRRFPGRYRLFSARSIRWNKTNRPNHNRLLGRARGVDGIKTGYTVPAGFNLAASSRRNGRRMIVVVLGARSAAARDLLVSNLLETGFSSSSNSTRRALIRAPELKRPRRD